MMRKSEGEKEKTNQLYWSFLFNLIFVLILLLVVVKYDIVDKILLRLGLEKRFRVESKYSCLESLDKYGEELDQVFEFRASNRDDWKLWRSSFTFKLQELIGGFENWGVPCELNSKVVERREHPGYIYEKVTFESEPGVIVPAIVLIPKGGESSKPTIICHHGHGPGKVDTIKLLKGREERNSDFAIDLVKEGFITISIDARSFGERGEDHQRFVCNSFLVGKSPLGQYVFDVLRTVDYLETREDVRTDRIGIVGFSMGGEVALFSAALDERIKVIVVSGFFGLFSKSLMRVKHCPCVSVPNILAYAELPDVAGLIAPRPLLIEAGEKDHYFPIEYTREAFYKLLKIYELLGSSERLQFFVHPGGHVYNGEKTARWFVIWFGRED